VIVVFEETGEEREVKTWCLHCQTDSDFTILSPSGKAHYAADPSDHTRCGIEATGDDWWHRL
jgi:hypothetical protein